MDFWITKASSAIRVPPKDKWCWGPKWNDLGKIPVGMGLPYALSSLWGVTNVTIWLFNVAMENPL